MQETKLTVAYMSHIQKNSKSCFKMSTAFVQKHNMAEVITWPLFEQLKVFGFNFYRVFL